MLATEDESIIASYRAFGWDLGIAFQLNDDLLGIWGPERATGKEPTDVPRKKKTLPVIYAFEHAAPVDRARLAALYANGRLTPAHTEEIVAILERGVRQEEGHVAFGEQRTMALLAERPALRPRLLGLALVSLWGVRRLGQWMQSRLPDHPALRQLPAFTEHVARLCAEHTDLDARLLDIAEGRWDDMAGFERALRDHIDREENGLFPAAAIAFAGPEWTEVDALTPPPGGPSA